MQVFAFVAPKIIGGKSAPTPVGELGMVEMSQALDLIDVCFEKVGNDCCYLLEKIVFLKDVSKLELTIVHLYLKKLETFEYSFAYLFLPFSLWFCWHLNRLDQIC